MSRIINLQKAKIYVLLFLCLASVLFFFRKEIKLLFIPDPEKDIIYEYSFHDSLIKYAKNIVEIEGFITEGKGGLELLPGTSGKMTFSFDKELQQGCLLRVWFYGDGGKERPNAIKISKDGGRTYKEVSSNGNYIGEVFDLSSYVKETKNFQILFEAENHAPFTPVVFDKIEVAIPKGEQVRSSLPNLPKIMGLVFLVFMIFYFIIKKDITRSERITVVFLVLIIMLAACLRWNELVRVSGTIVSGDAKGYFNFAAEMDLFSDNGFYSAQFDKREPLYIFIVRVFFLLFGISETHLRFVSFVFSLVVIYLTYRIGREWFNNIVGLIAAFILSVHPYLVSLSARGLRAELFTTLLLLFIYFGYIKTSMNSRWRVLFAGFLTGCILLTRSESLPLLVIILVFYPILSRPQWSYKMVLVTLILGILLWIPHIYSLSEKHGDPFYTMNKYTRFYANREFMGKPGFPTKEEIIEKGMYTGPEITPAEYYFKLHTPWQLIKYNVIGFIKIHITMPFSFALGKGNLRKVTYSIKELRGNYGREQLIKTGKLFISILRKDFWNYFMTFIVLMSFLGGLILMALSHSWIMFLYLVLFQMQTSFLAYLGLDARLSIHSYPLIALCCGYALYWVIVRRRFTPSDV